jgi:hypothetical protein
LTKIRRAGATVLIAIFMLAGAAFAQLGPAPEGDPTVVAGKIIRQRFDDKGVCPLAVETRRVGDGSIMALRTNGERFRIMESNALRCASAGGKIPH